jgi:LysM repeat protein
MKELTADTKKRSRKLDWIIYSLALVSFLLMMVVIITNHKTSLKTLEIEPSISRQGDYESREKKPAFDTQSQKKEIPMMDEMKEELKEEKKEEPLLTQDEKLADEIIEQKEEKKEALTQAKPEEKEKALPEEDIKQKQVPSMAQKEKKPAVKEKPGSYNWDVLSHYPAKPSKGLEVVQQYKVKTGDALWKIAKKFNVRTINIIAVNQKMNNPDKIFPGQTISIPNK